MAPSSPNNRSGAGAGLLDHVLGDGLIVAVLVGWWLYSRNVPEYIFPSPTVVGSALLSLATDPELIVNILASAARVSIAVVTATLIGAALALMAHYYPITREIVHARIKPFLLSFPSIGWALLAIVWFNISNSAVIFVEVVVLVPFCLVNVSEGLQNMDAELLEMSRSFTRNGRKTFFKVVWPLLFPFIIAGMRMSYGVGLKIALVAEVFGANSGLGHLLYQAEDSADTPMVFAACLAIVILFATGDRLIFEPLSRLYRGSAVAVPAGRSL
jgi:NitT/TauT family transport system permease protein